MTNKKSILYPTLESLSAEQFAQPCVYCYELVYMLMPGGKNAFIFAQGTADSAVSRGVDGPLHKSYHDRALKGEKVVYEWSLEDGGVKYLQSTLLPLKTPGEKDFNVLGIVRDLSVPGAGANIVRDLGGSTFAQILIKTKEEEKKKIASALHDEIGSTAVILTSILSILQEDIKEDKKESALERVRELDAQIKECVDKIKNLVVTMRPPSIDAVGLDGTVKELVESLNKFANVKIEYDYKETDDGKIDDEAKIMLYRVVQEGLNNAIKHSKASKITVSLQNLENIVKIEVSDNGIGFKKTKQKRLNQIGLLGMEESVKYLGGKFEIQTSLGKGTKIKVSCPKIIYKVAI